MDKTTGKIVFLSIVSFLVLAILGLSIFFAGKEPEKASDETGVQLLNKTADTGNLYVKDIYEGEMQIPDYDIPLSKYAVKDFQATEAGISYKNVKQGIVLKEQNQSDTAAGETKPKIDWVQVKNSGVDFAYLRVGYRDYITGQIIIDKDFSDNIEGATAAGLDVGVYFYSQAVKAEEAQEEAQTVLTQIKGYQVKYPLMIKWKYASAVDASQVRTKDITAQQITEVVKAFCSKVKAEGYTPSFYATKTLGYETLDLTALSDFDMWYSEYRAAPAFYYDFKIWEYTEEAAVAGIEGQVRRCLALKDYV